MLISHSHKFIFVHIYKVAGSSVTAALQPYAESPRHTFFGKLLRKTGLGRRRLSELHPHLKAREIQALLPQETFLRFFKFAFVRNPWDWQVSLYVYALSNKAHPQHKLIAAMHSFDEYIQWRVHKDLHLQQEFILDDCGRQIVDFVGKLENIRDDFAFVCKRLGVGTRLPHLNATPHKDYRSYYSSRSARLVEEHFKEDIERFGYRFGG